MQDVYKRQLYTRKGCKAQIVWTSATDAMHVTPLNELNGMDSTGQVYLPQLPQPISLTCTGDNVQVGGIDPSHEDDVDLNYEPTVNPEASGGYVWVVFTSRRMYGSEATIPPFCSDPRGVNLITNITTKKLWVAAVDLGATPGTDASHPAFYLPGQELLAGNSRGFWVLEPCRANGQSCQSGDQCCNCLLYTSERLHGERRGGRGFRWRRKPGRRVARPHARLRWRWRGPGRGLDQPRRAGRLRDLAGRRANDHGRGRAEHSDGDLHGHAEWRARRRGVERRSR